MRSEFSLLEFLHTTCGSGYFLYILHGLNIHNQWIHLIGSLITHYFLTILEPSFFGWLLFILAIGLFIGKTIKQKKIQECRIDPKTVIDSLRFIVCSLVCISIFTCDFNIYPVHKLKSKFYGISLMDFGVTSFMFNAGMICGVSHKFRPRKSIYMLIMGIIRLCVLQCGYHSDYTEYGVHLNFYFIYCICETLSVLFKHINSLSVACCMLLIHESILFRDGFIDYVFYSDRIGFVNGNREGIISIIPYIGTLFLGKYVGEVLFRKEKNLRKSLKFLQIFLILLLVHYVSSIFIEPSRRLCSLSFTSLSCSAIVFPMFLYYLTGAINSVPAGCPFFELSGLMGPLFLLSNFYVLIGNILFDWRKVSTFAAHSVNILYMFLLFVLPLYIYKKIYK